MEFKVPVGAICTARIDLYPALPVSGVAQTWRMVDTSASPRAEIDRLDVWFSTKSSPQQRQLERMNLVFSIAEEVQSEAESWRFTSGGVMYCRDEADYLNDVEFAITNDAKTLTASVISMTDLVSSFNFSFIALHKDNKSGVCQILASADPGGSSGRRD